MEASSGSVSVGLARAMTAMASELPDLPLWSCVLQWIDADGDGVPVRSLPARSCLSRRALTTALKFMSRRGLGEVVGSGSSKLARLSPAGVSARESLRPAVSALGSGWPSVDALRSSLVEVVSRLELEHPHFPVQYGTADCSIRGGPGQDWKPVPRVDASGVSSLPLSALLSQAYVALAIEYEKTNGALAQGANVLALVPDDGLAVASLSDAGRSVLSGLERHGRVRVDDGVIHLTEVGRRRRDRHQPALEEIAVSWRRAFGDAVVDGLGSALDAVVAALPAMGEVRTPPLRATFGMPG